MASMTTRQETSVTTASQAAPTPQIRVEHVSKQFSSQKAERTVAVHDVGFDVAAGEFLSIIGASGCGKTTLLRMISGLVGYDAGTIYLRDAPVRTVPRGVGFVFQQPSLMPWRSVRQNIAMGLTGASKEMQETAKERVDSLLELTGLSDFAEHLPRQLSGGMQQRAGLARALVSEPDVLLMDEPLGALDAFTRMRLQDELIVMLERIKTTTVLVTHDVDEAIYLSDRILVLASRPGRVREIINVPLSRPRNRDQMLGNAELAAVRDEILGLIVHQDDH
jgi:sulfonate transport system ATP-binding protein